MPSVDGEAISSLHHNGSDGHHCLSGTKEGTHTTGKRDDCGVCTTFGMPICSAAACSFIGSANSGTISRISSTSGARTHANCADTPASRLCTKPLNDQTRGSSTVASSAVSTRAPVATTVTATAACQTTCLPNESRCAPTMEEALMIYDALPASTFHLSRNQLTLRERLGVYHAIIVFILRLFLIA
ncbi:unnamed protein product [Protopolystoma xenopodis]|uniref:Uncharacterized protein n=1 Tax=Protopolystoma xenopodis TaxID=117903 RepID=A0A3S5AXP1_9PLAT|nr:unnamed protein product [Protopolystoma xenopodis]